MAGPRLTRFLLALGTLACLAWAGVEARHLGGLPQGLDPCAARPSDPGAVEASYAAIRAALAEGRDDEALLALRDWARRGPYPGYAWFLLGEAAYHEGAPAAAVGHWRKAVEADATVADRAAAFGAGRAIARRLAELREGPWAENPPPEIRDLYFLQRRLAGGCE